MKVIRAKQNGHLDNRTTIGKVSKKFNKAMEISTIADFNEPKPLADSITEGHEWYSDNNNKWNGKTFSKEKVAKFFKVNPKDIQRIWVIDDRFGIDTPNGDHNIRMWPDVDHDNLFEELSRRVGDGGKSIDKKEDEKGRARNARHTSSLSRSERRRISRKAANTRTKRQSDIDSSKEKRERSIEKREKLGLSEMKTFDQLISEGPIDWILKQIETFLNRKQYDNLEVVFDHAVKRNMFDNPGQFKNAVAPPEDTLDLMSAANYLKYKKTGKISVLPGLLKFAGISEEDYEEYMKRRFEIVKKKFNLPN